MKRIRRRTRNRIIGISSTLVVLMLGVMLVATINFAGNDLHTQVLGDAINYGIVADTITQTGHMDTNFAAREYDSAASFTCGKFTGDRPGVTIAHHVNNILSGDHAIVETGMDVSKLNVQVKNFEAKTKTVKDEKGKDVEVFDHYDRNASVTKVDGLDTKVKNMLNHVQSQSETIAKRVTTDVKINGDSVDISDVPEEQVFVNCSGVDPEKLTITKRESQVVVLNFCEYGKEEGAQSATLKSVKTVKSQNENVSSDAETKEDDATETPKAEDVASVDEAEKTEAPVVSDVDDTDEGEDSDDDDKSDESVSLLGVPSVAKAAEKTYQVKSNQKSYKLTRPTVIYKESGEFKYSRSPELNDERSRKLTETIIFNFPYANKLEIVEAAGTILAPRADVELQNSAGWLVCNKVTGTPGEWHFVYKHVYTPTATPKETATPTPTPVPTSPVIEYPIEVTKEFLGNWPDGAKFKFDIEAVDVANGHIDYSDLKSVILTKDKSTKSMGTIKFDLKDFDGQNSNTYANTKCYPYMFKVTEDSTYQPNTGVDYDLIDYDTTPRFIKIWVNVTYDDKGNIVKYWIEPREAVGNAACSERKGATKFTNSTVPFIDFPIDVTKKFVGEWPDGAEFKFDITVDDATKRNKYIDYSGLHSVILTKDETTQSMGSVRFKLKNFDGWNSGAYANTKCYPYMFTITEDASYKPTDKGVNYDAITYDTTPRHIKIWVNVMFDANGKVVKYWTEPREAVGDADCTERKGATEFTNKVELQTQPPTTQPPTTQPPTTQPPTTQPPTTQPPTTQPPTTQPPTTQPPTTQPPTTQPPTTQPPTTQPPTTQPPTTQPPVTTAPVVTTQPPVNTPPTNTPPTTYTNPPSNTPPIVYYTFSPAPTETPTTIVEEEVPLSNFTPEEKPKEETTTIIDDVPLAATVPETGDTMHPMVPIAGMGLSLLAMLGVVVIRKKKFTK